MKDGELYKQHDPLRGYNNFYNTQYNSTVNFIYNQDPSVIKNFKTLSYEGTENWYANTIETDQQSGKISNFINKEGKWFNNIKGIANTTNDLDTKEFSIQGLGNLGGSSGGSGGSVTLPPIPSPTDVANTQWYRIEVYPPSGINASDTPISPTYSNPYGYNFHTGWSNSLTDLQNREGTVWTSMAFQFFHINTSIIQVGSYVADYLKNWVTSNDTHDLDYHQPYSFFSTPKYAACINPSTWSGTGNNWTHAADQIIKVEQNQGYLVVTEIIIP
jgi:hypothetical protein